MESLEKIDDYLAGRLLADEKELFEKELKLNPALDLEVSKQYLAKEAIRISTIRKTVKEAQLQYLTESNLEIATLPTIKKSWTIYLTRIAASVAIIAMSIGAFQFYNLNTEEVLAENGIKYQATTIRGSSPSINELETAYKSTDYLLVIDLFEKSQQNNEKEQFLTSMAYYNLKKYDNSLKLINKMLENKEENFQYINELKYYKGLNLIGSNNFDEAIPYFENLKNDDKNPYSKSISKGFILKMKALALKY